MSTTPRIGDKKNKMTVSRHVLLVDDNDIVRELTQAMLERDGFVVTPAESGELALTLARELPRVDLLVSDVFMPGMNGVHLADRLLELHPEASVLFTSGHTDDRILAPGSVPAGAAFLPKPFSMAELVRTAQDVFAATEVLAGSAAIAV